MPKRFKSAKKKRPAKPRGPKPPSATRDRPAAVSEKPRICFLSHSSQSNDDKDFADELAKVLAKHDIEVWYSIDQVVPGQNWLNEIHDALHRCNWFLVVLSTSVLDSKWVKEELNFAFADDRFDERIVPLLRDDYDWKRYHWRLAAIQHIDFRDFDTGCTDLLRLWGIEYLKP